MKSPNIILLGIILLLHHSCCRDRFYSFKAKKYDYQFEPIDEYMIKNYSNLDSNYIKKTFADYKINYITSDSISISNKSMDKVFYNKHFKITKNTNNYHYNYIGELQKLEYYYAGRLQKRYIRKGRKMARDYFIIISPPM